MNSPSETNERGIEKPGGRFLPRINIDLAANPDLQFRVDSFQVPNAARAVFKQAMHRNLAFLETQPGFRGHVVLERTGGPTAFNVATIAVWEDQKALEAAREAVSAYYEQIGFDAQSLLARLGIKAELGNFRAPREAQ